MRFPSAISLIFCFITVFVVSEATAQKKEFVATVDTYGIQRI